MPYVEVNQASLYYQKSGQGTPIIFVHPPLLSGVNFYYQQLELSEQFQVITFDIRGHGKSTSGTTPLTYSLIVEDIIKILKSLQIDKAYIAGYSTGAGIALEAMKEYQEMFHGGILLSPMISPPSLYIKSLIQLATLLANKTTIPLLAKAICSGNADCYSTWKRLYNEAIQGDPQKIKEYFQCSLSFQFLDSLQEVEQPTLLLFGEKDTDFIKTKQILHTRLPNNSIKTFHNVSHQIPTKAAKSVNTAIADFLIDQA